jgi:hypothetical protein
LLIAERLKGKARGRTLISADARARTMQRRVQDHRVAAPSHAIGGAQICKLNQNIMTRPEQRLRISSSFAPLHVPRARVQSVAGVRGRANFHLPLGHRRFPVKGS